MYNYTYGGERSAELGDGVGCIVTHMEGRGQQLGDGPECTVTDTEQRGQQFGDGVRCTVTHIQIGEISSSVTMWGVQLHTYGWERSAAR